MADSESSGTTYQAEENNNSAVRYILLVLNQTRTNPISLAVFVLPTSRPFH